MEVLRSAIKLKKNGRKKCWIVQIIKERVGYDNRVHFKQDKKMITCFYFIKINHTVFLEYNFNIDVLYKIDK